MRAPQTLLALRHIPLAANPGICLYPSQETPITDYQAKYLAFELTKRCPSDSVEKLASAVAGAQVDLNPHQVDAALFAFQSPLSKGAILADEVGLGKTIEAGLVISQKWAERKRRILIITPSNLRKQWHQEMNEKFFLPCAILETKSYNAAIKMGTFSPFEPKEDAVVICSYQFARNKAADVHRTSWDLVVIDEAHRLRNVYKPSNIIANVLKGALQERHKLLLKALDVAFAKARELGAAEKAIIFTESRKTQSYLLCLLGDSPWAEGIVLFNGSNTDDTSKAIYARWVARHQGSDKITGSRTADMRSALVDYFREQGRIMIATEAGAEGINLQFCSLVVNYDLPWNPQRIEQRIGRCHRYGQKHDVVVVNFLNRKNEADLRVFQLLDEKFQLFTGVFGSSDEVLGAIESGVDFEKRIAAIYQDCRRPEEIKTAFDALQLELDFEINEAMTATRRKLLENFDDEVRDKLKIRDDASKSFLNRFERQLIQLTRHELNGHADFGADSSFNLHSIPESLRSLRSFAANEIPLSRYQLPRRSGEAHLYRLGHPLAEHVITQAKSRDLPIAEVEFRYADHCGKISILEPIQGKSGTLAVSMFTVESMDQAEDHLIFAACTDDESLLTEDQARRLLTLPAIDLTTKNTENTKSLPGSEPLISSSVFSVLSVVETQRQSEIQRQVSERNALFYEAEAAKLDGWADDLKVGLEREIKEFDRQLKETRRASVTALTLEDKLESQKQIKAIEAQRNEKRRSLFEAQDAIDRQREGLISRIEGKLLQETRLEPLFRLRWRMN